MIFLLFLSVLVIWRFHVKRLRFLHETGVSLVIGTWKVLMDRDVDESHRRLTSTPQPYSHPLFTKNRLEITDLCCNISRVLLIHVAKFALTLYQELEVMGHMFTPQSHGPLPATLL